MKPLLPGWPTWWFVVLAGLALLRADTTARLDALLDEIGEIDGVLRTNSSVVLALRVDRSA